MTAALPHILDRSTGRATSPPGGRQRHRPGRRLAHHHAARRRDPHGERRGQGPHRDGTAAPWTSRPTLTSSPPAPARPG